MKTLRIVYVIAIAILIHSQMMAQELQIPSDVLTTFNGFFPKAANIKWQKDRSVYVATFLNNNQLSISFINDRGDLLTRGRKINLPTMPIAVFENMNSVTSSLEKKYGALAIGNVFEITHISGKTEYFVSIHSSEYDLTLSVNNSSADLKHKHFVGRRDDTPLLAKLQD